MTSQDGARAWIERDPKSADLTDRRQEVARRPAAGETIAHVAAARNRRPATVANHVHAIRFRMGTSRRSV